MRSTKVFLTLITIGFFILSKAIFDSVYLTSNLIIDEEFHLHLGKAYCHYEFTEWHPKVTTFPGLYLLSSLIFGSFDLCTTYWLRFTSLLFSIINIFLFHSIIKINNEQAHWNNIFSAINLALLPPLYFFSHLYYTDVASLTMILLLLYCSQKGQHYLASLFGLCAVLFRQTNIIWVGMAGACYILNEINNTQHQTCRNQVTTHDFIDIVKRIRSNLSSVLEKTNLRFWLNALCYMSISFFFLLFIYFNGSIVVGDKTAHEATVHLPQLFYFSLFCLVFGWPHFLPEVGAFFKFLSGHKSFAFLLLLGCTVIVYFNTLVHPYVLADNRHYIFYIWNRFYGRYYLFRFLMIPAYIFSWFVIIRRLHDKRDITFLLFFLPCTGVVLITQRLLEFRYFFVPYVLFRLRLKNVSRRSLFYEFFTYLIINICTFYLFFTKTIYWENYVSPQRLIW